MDIYVQATFESSDWSKETVTKKTDVHNGSKDGHGSFNYRLKFPFELPGEPRLKLQVYDNMLVGASELIGGDSILLKP